MSFLFSLAFDLVEFGIKSKNEQFEKQLLSKNPLLLFLPQVYSFSLVI
jgi:hypothetical protein